MRARGRTAAALRLACTLLGLASGALGCAGRGAPREAVPPTPEALRVAIAGALAAPGPAETWLEPRLLARFYARRGSLPAWVEPQGAQPRTRRLLDALETASRHGLRPGAYHAEAVARLLGGRLESRPMRSEAEPSEGQSPSASVQRAQGLAGLAAGPTSPQDLARLDLLAADGFLHLARHLSRGAVDPQALHPGYEREPLPDLVGSLEAALASGDPETTLAELAPPHSEYAYLMRAFARLRSDPVEAAAPSAEPSRAERIRANLERWRWAPRRFGDRHLRVNVAEFRLRAFEGASVQLDQPVVVGCGGWETPPTHGAIGHLVLNPAWEIPRSIAVRELLPAEQRQPGTLERSGIQVLERDASGVLQPVEPGRVDWRALDADHFPFRLRQPAGPENPMGRIKFAFPNPYGIWLHGSPGRAAFERPLRNLSHGCVRVQDEIGLALFALAPDPSWTRSRLLAELDTGKEQWVALPAPLPVHVLYLTASADAQGEASFAADPYGWDRALLALLPPGPAARP